MDICVIDFLKGKYEKSGRQNGKEVVHGLCRRTKGRKKVCSPKNKGLIEVLRFTSSPPGMLLPQVVRERSLRGTRQLSLRWIFQVVIQNIVL